MPMKKSYFLLLAVLLWGCSSYIFLQIINIILSKFRVSYCLIKCFLKLCQSIHK